MFCNYKMVQLTKKGLFRDHLQYFLSSQLHKDIHMVLFIWFLKLHRFRSLEKMFVTIKWSSLQKGVSSFTAKFS